MTTSSISAASWALPTNDIQARKDFNNQNQNEPIDNSIVYLAKQVFIKHRSVTTTVVCAIGIGAMVLGSVIACPLIPIITIVALCIFSSVGVFFFMRNTNKNNQNFMRTLLLSRFEIRLKSCSSACGDIDRNLAKFERIKQNSIFSDEVFQKELNTKMDEIKKAQKELTDLVSMDEKISLQIFETDKEHILNNLSCKSAEVEEYLNNITTFIKKFLINYNNSLLEKLNNPNTTLTTQEKELLKTQLISNKTCIQESDFIIEKTIEYLENAKKLIDIFYP